MLAVQVTRSPSVMSPSSPSSEKQAFRDTLGTDCSAVLTSKAWAPFSPAHTKSPSVMSPSSPSREKHAFRDTLGTDCSAVLTCWAWAPFSPAHTQPLQTE